jgi:hypothetical protein
MPDSKHLAFEIDARAHQRSNCGVDTGGVASSRHDCYALHLLATILPTAANLQLDKLIFAGNSSIRLKD